MSGMSGKTTSMKSTLVNFGESTSVKGIPKVLKTPQTCLKVMWFAAVITGAGIAFYQLSTLFIRYFKYESVTRLQYCNDCKPAFPDVTVCNLNPLNTLTEYKDQIQDFDAYLDHIDYLSESLDLQQIMQDLGVTMDQLYDIYDEAFSVSGYFQNINTSVTEQLSQRSNLGQDSNLILDCKWYGWDGKLYPKEDCNMQSIYPTYSPEYFVCYTFHLNNSNPLSNETDISSLFATLYLNDFSTEIMRTLPESISQTQSRGVRVQIHAQNTLPDMSKGFNVAPGHEIQIQLKANEYWRLGTPYSECTETEYLDEGDTDVKMKDGNSSISYVYTDKACMSLCHQQINLKDCNCFNPHLPYTKAMRENNPEIPYCGLVEDDINETIKRISCHLFVQDNAESFHCDCLQPCHQNMYDYQLLQSPWPHESYHKVFYRNTIRRQSYRDKFDIYQNISKLEDMKKVDLIERNFIQLKVLFQEEGHSIFTAVPAVTFDGLFGSMGGILNLWIGITFFTVIELLDLVYKIIEIMLHKKKQNTKVVDIESGHDTHKEKPNVYHNQW